MELANSKLINVADFEQAAQHKLSKMAFGYYASGAYDEITLAENCRAFDRVALHYRVLRDVSSRNLEAKILGRSASMPLFIAPTAFHRLAHDDGELATARAASAAGVPFVLSTLSNQPVEDVVRAASGPVWFQLYVYRDRGLTRDLVDRAVEAGCEALVLTVDAQIMGVRERDVRNRFRLPDGLHAANLTGTSSSKVAFGVEGSSLTAYVEKLFDPALSWSDVEWLTSLTDVPIVVKGIVHPQDAVLAAQRGARAVVVSNHGGRQLDTAPATLDVLPRVVDAAGEHLEVLVDGGIRRGSDLLKCLAYGASAAGVGRPALWGLAVDGQAGVQRVLAILRDELDRALGLCGFSDVTSLSRDILTG
ncbi:MAG: alpha-hydroxy acid oxidase [Acidobacteriota bacterium]